MCLTIPGRVVDVLSPEPTVRTARIDFRGNVRSANLLYAPDVKVGDYVIVQAGFVIRRLSESEALEALEYARQIDTMNAEPSNADAPQRTPKARSSA